MLVMDSNLLAQFVVVWRPGSSLDERSEGNVSMVPKHAERTNRRHIEEANWVEEANERNEVVLEVRGGFR